MSQVKHGRRNRAIRRRRNESTRCTSRESLAALQNWFLPNGGIFSRLRFHGNTSWLPVSLVWLAVTWSWSIQPNLTDAFDDALSCCRSLSLAGLLGTFQGFMGALVRWTDAFIPLLFAVLQTRMEKVGSKFWRVGRWVPIAFDGSRSSAPRTKNNELALRPAHYGMARLPALEGRRRRACDERRTRKTSPSLRSRRLGSR
jgi:hypothetical protein